MTFLHALAAALKPNSCRPAGRRARWRPEPCCLESLEQRVVLSATLAIADAMVVEGHDGTRYAETVVTLSQPASRTVTVGFNTADGTAKAGADYGAVSGVLSFAPGETSKTVRVPIRGDRLGEADESFVVQLKGAKNAKIVDGAGVVTIRDDEPRVSIGNAVATEGNAGTTLLTFTVTLSAAYDQAVTVNYATADGTAVAGDDYAATRGTLTFAAGETTKTFTVAIFGDTSPEGDEYFFVNLSGPSGNSLIGVGQGQGTIRGDDGDRWEYPEQPWYDTELGPYAHTQPDPYSY